MTKKKLYANNEWIQFSRRVQKRDGEKCLKCHRSSPNVILQTHHKIYIPNKQPWEYALSDCITLCKGCHAREHGHIEPNSGWFLISIDDLGDLIGICERRGCGNEIRYEHLTYHPNWGYRKVGSTCIEHLTQKDKNRSSIALALYKNISKFVHGSEWNSGTTKKGKSFISTKHRHNLIRIYGENPEYAFQILLKEKGRKFYHYKDIVNLSGKSLEEVKELSYIALKGTTSEDNKEKAMLRELYKNIRESK